MADVFPYYAGFSFEWAAARIVDGNLTPNAVVLDPWNGSGTTTLAAQLSGVRSVGVDLNPVASIVARLRVSAIPGFDVVPAPDVADQCDPSDPLLAWFSPKTTARLRDWANQALSSPFAPDLAVVALFRLVRRLTADFQGSNPTWVRRTTADRAAVHVSRKQLDALVIGEQTSLIRRLAVKDISATPSILLTASSKNLPIADGSVDFVLTSPPYLTRIDYAVAYSRELAVLGTDISADRRLRERLMGTTLIRRSDERDLSSYGPIARDLIHRIATHYSHASSGYYRKQVRQYLNDLTDSISEVTRVCTNTAAAVIVVQDSYYKEVPVRLADICEEEAVLRGWIPEGKHPYQVVHSLATLNRAAKAYPKGPVSETVIKLKRS